MAEVISHSDRTSHAVRVVLQSGLCVSACLLVLGSVLIFAHHEPRPVLPPESSSHLLEHAVHGQGLAMVHLGILILLLTPGLRVAVLVCSWSWQRDWRYASVAGIVLLLLATSIIIGAS